MGLSPLPLVSSGQLWSIPLIFRSFELQFRAIHAHLYLEKCALHYQPLTFNQGAWNHHFYTGDCLGSAVRSKIEACRTGTGTCTRDFNKEWLYIKNCGFYHQSRKFMVHRGLKGEVASITTTIILLILHGGLGHILLVLPNGSGSGHPALTFESSVS